jgi:chemotaxis protein MotB
MDGKRFQAVGVGEYRPIDTNDTPEGRQKNRRVNILIITKDK